MCQGCCGVASSRCLRRSLASAWTLSSFRPLWLHTTRRAGRLEASPALLPLKLLPEIQRFDMHGFGIPDGSLGNLGSMCVCVCAWHGKALDSAVNNPGLVASKADWAAVNEAMATSALTTVLKRSKNNKALAQQLAHSLTDSLILFHSGSLCLSVSLSLSPSLPPSLPLSLPPSFCLCLSVCLSLSLSVFFCSLSLSLSLCLSLCPSLSLSRMLSPLSYEP